MSYCPYTKSRMADKYRYDKGTIKLALPTATGVRGLRVAVVLMALADGCCDEWVEELSFAYDVDLPEGWREKARASEVKRVKKSKEGEYREEYSVLHCGHINLLG